jgi:hypothetical protein
LNIVSGQQLDALKAIEEAEKVLSNLQETAEEQVARLKSLGWTQEDFARELEATLNPSKTILIICEGGIVRDVLNAEQEHEIADLDVFQDQDQKAGDEFFASLGPEMQEELRKHWWSYLPEHLRR